ncbi:MAG: GIY-YIG nuclease family protein [Candidatus Bathyarchaeota archaeon]|nr:MAG: GIY-YIG nuclease family protein [Candidatus Bathyarchaeota archaeon]
MRGVYVLIIQIDKDVSMNVGALGKLTFEKGLYAYVGSAQVNLEQRIKRHFGKEKRLFWHIDYLLDDSLARIVKVLYKQANRSEECEIAKAISERGEPAAGFGCSDCSCKSHLFRIGDYRFLQESMRVLHAET